MRLALLGGGNEAANLAVAAARLGHSVVALCDMPAGDPLESSPLAARASHTHWEDLLGGLAEAVIVGRTSADPAAREDQLRKLVQQAVPLAVVHPGCEAITGFELEMIRRDLGASIASYLPILWDPAIAELEALFGAEGRLGPMRQVGLEREGRAVSLEEIWNLLAGDIELVRRWFGPIRLVSALGTPPEQLMVQATTVGGAAAQWSFGPVLRSAGVRIALTGAGGKAVLALTDEAGSTSRSLQIVDQASEETREIAAGDPAARFLEGWLGKGDSAEAISVPKPEWAAACRDVETAETARHSLRRNKTLELYHEEHSEQQTFKGMMAAGGCLALLLTLAAFLVAMLLDSLLPLREFGWWRAWPVCVFAPLGIFLLLQAVQVILALDRRHGSKERPPES